MNTLPILVSFSSKQKIKILPSLFFALFTSKNLVKISSHSSGNTSGEENGQVKVATWFFEHK